MYFFVNERFNDFLQSYGVTLGKTYPVFGLLVGKRVLSIAEPVGVRFGKYQYKTKALFTNKEYFRTLEGSACVLISGFIIIAMHVDYFTTLQFALAMLFVPIIMTLTEAYSPHTWDTPFLMFTGYVSLLLIMQF